MFGRLTPMVKSLLIVNVGVFLAGMILPFPLEMYLALFPFDTSYFKPYQLFSYMFAHGGFLHLMFNMIMLWVFGAILEQFWGANKFLIFYMIAGIGAAVFYAAINFIMNPQPVPMLGASGAVYGLLMASAMLFPNMQLMLLFPPIPVKLKWMALILGGLALYSSFNRGEGDNVAHLAHLGGMVFGFVILKIWGDRRQY